MIEECVIDMAVERFPVVSEDIIDTHDERWAGNNAGWYGTACEFAAKTLGNGKGKWCLIIGSPLPELLRIQSLGWDTVYCDIRNPPADIGRFIEADATQLPCGDEFYDAVSSTCVICHAGLGRYGDPIKPNGDLLMLREIYRVLKPGGVASLMLGPASHQMKTSIVYGNVHRMYEPDEALDMCRQEGFTVKEYQLCISPAETSSATELEEAIAKGEDDTIVVRYCYLSVLLRKPE